MPSNQGFGARPRWPNQGGMPCHQHVADAEPGTWTQAVGEVDGLFLPGIGGLGDYDLFGYFYGNSMDKVNPG